MCLFFEDSVPELSALVLSSVEDDAPESEELALSELEELDVLGVLRSNSWYLIDFFNTRYWLIHFNWSVEHRKREE